MGVAIVKDYKCSCGTVVLRTAQAFSGEVQCYKCKKIIRYSRGKEVTRVSGGVKYLKRITL